MKKVEISQYSDSKLFINCVDKMTDQHTGKVNKKAAIKMFVAAIKNQLDAIPAMNELKELATLTYISDKVNKSLDHPIIAEIEINEEYMIKNHLTFNDMDQLIAEKVHEIALQRPSIMISLIN